MDTSNYRKSTYAHIKKRLRLYRVLRISLMNLFLVGFSFAYLLIIPGAAGAVTLEFWHPWPHAERTVRNLSREYTRETGVVVRVRAVSPSSYHPWTARNAPDLIGLSHPTKRNVEELARAGRAYNISSEMGHGWYSRFWPGMLETFRISRASPTGVYGVPLTGQVHMFVYNKTAFAKAGISRPPATWSELMRCSRLLHKVGVTPYAGGFSSRQPPLAYVYEWSYMGIHNLAQTYFSHHPYTSTDWVRQLGLYPEMRSHGFTDAKWASMSETSAAKAMLDGRVAMVFIGPSFESVRRAYKPQFMSWGLFGGPMDGRARFLPRLPGSVVEGLVVNRRSNRKVEAIKFARWLTDPARQVAFANGASSIPATPAASSSPELHSHLRAFASGMRDQAIDLRVYEQPEALDTLYAGVRRMLGGSNTPSAVAQSVQRVKRK